MKKPFKPCRHPGCNKLTRDGYCEPHKDEAKAWHKTYDQKRLRGRKLQAERKRLFEDQPLCVECLKIGRITAATERDHIIPLSQGGKDVPENTQALCKECHERKTLKEAKAGRGG